jgi:hypothetical protein
MSAWSFGIVVDVGLSGRPGLRSSVGTSPINRVASSYARLRRALVAVRISSTEGAGNAKRSATARAIKRIAAATEDDKAATEATSEMHSFCLRCWTLVYLPAWD